MKLSFNFKLAAATAIATAAFYFLFKDAYSFQAAVLSGQAVETYSEASVIVNDITCPSGSFKVGEKIEIRLILENTGDTEAKNILIKARVNEDIDIISERTVKVLSAKKNNPKYVYFTLSPNKKSDTKKYNAYFDIEYENGRKDSKNRPLISKITKKTDFFVENGENDNTESNSKNINKSLVNITINNNYTNGNNSEKNDTETKKIEIITDDKYEKKEKNKPKDDFDSDYNKNHVYIDETKNEKKSEDYKENENETFTYLEKENYENETFSDTAKETFSDAQNKITPVKVIAPAIPIVGAVFAGIFKLLKK